MTVARGNSSERKASRASSASSWSPCIDAATGSTTNGVGPSAPIPTRSQASAIARMIAEVASMPVFAASSPMSVATASICAATVSGGSVCTPVTPTVFCTVTAVTARQPCTPHAVSARRSAATPAPPPESVPAIVMTRGGVFVADPSAPALTIAVSGQDVGFGVQPVGVVGAAELGVLAGRRPALFDLCPRRPRGRPPAAARPRPRPARRRSGDRTAARRRRVPRSTAPAFSIAASADRSAETATASRGLEGGGERSTQRDGVHRRNTSAPRPVTKTCL